VALRPGRSDTLILNLLNSTVVWHFRSSMWNIFSLSPTQCQERLRKTFLKVFVGSCLSVILLYAAVPSLRKVIIRENNFLELITAVLYVGVCFYGWRLCLQITQQGGKKIFWLIPVFGLLGFLEEESFGHSFLYFVVPKVQGIQFDSLHDLLPIGVVWVTTWELKSQILLLGVLIGGGVYLCCRIYSLWGPILAYLTEHPPFWYVMVCGVLLFLALILDLEKLSFPGLQLSEELLETQASVALAWSCFSMKCVLASYSESKKSSQIENV